MRRVALFFAVLMMAGAFFALGCSKASDDEASKPEAPKDLPPLVVQLDTPENTLKTWIQAVERKELDTVYTQLHDPLWAAMNARRMGCQQEAINRRECEERWGYLPVDKCTNRWTEENRCLCGITSTTNPEPIPLQVEDRHRGLLAAIITSDTCQMRAPTEEESRNALWDLPTCDETAARWVQQALVLSCNNLMGALTDDTRKVMEALYAKQIDLPFVLVQRGDQWRILTTHGFSWVAFDAIGRAHKNSSGAAQPSATVAAAPSTIQKNFLQAAAITVVQDKTRRARLDGLNADLAGWRKFRGPSGQTLSDTFFAPAGGGLAGDVAEMVDKLFSTLDQTTTTGLNRWVLKDIQNQYVSIMAAFIRLNRNEKAEMVELGQATHTRLRSVVLGFITDKWRFMAEFSRATAKDIKRLSNSTERRGHKQRIRIIHQALGGTERMHSVVGLSGDRDDRSVYRDWFRQQGRIHPAQMAALRQGLTAALAAPLDESSMRNDAPGPGATANGAVGTLYRILGSNDAYVEEKALQTKEFLRVLNVGYKLARPTLRSYNRR